MLKRKAHRKSRLGCRNCKLRRNKCDEIHPACGNCVKLAIPCGFDSSDRILKPGHLAPVKLPPLRKRTSGRSPSAATRIHANSPKRSSSAVTSISRRASSSPLPDFAIALEALLLMRPPLQTLIGSPANRLLDLKLFHHYVQMISTTPGTEPLSKSHETKSNQPHLWAKWITTLAFSNQSLMDALLGFSAFHLRSLNPLDHSLFEVSHKYMVKALEGHANELRQGVNESNAEVAFATSTFIASHTCSDQRFLSVMESPLQAPLHWFRAYRGVRAILEKGWEWIKTSEIRPSVTIDFEFDNTVIKYQDLGNGSTFGFLLKDLDLGSYDIETTQCYNSAVATLDWITNSGNPRNILKFPAMASPRFIQLLTLQDPRVLTIVGYFFMLLKKAKTIWWLKGTVDMEFWALMDLIPKSWRPQMELALCVFSE